MIFVKDGERAERLRKEQWWSAKRKMIRDAHRKDSFLRRNGFSPNPSETKTEDDNQ